MVVGLAGFAAIVSPGVRGILVGLVAVALGLVLLVGLMTVLVVGLVWRMVRRHPIADLAMGYLIGRHRGRRRVGHGEPVYMPPYYPPPRNPPPNSWR